MKYSEKQRPIPRKTIKVFWFLAPTGGMSSGAWEMGSWASAHAHPSGSTFLPPGRCSQGFHRKCLSWHLLTCSLCTFQSLLFWYVHLCLTGCYRASSLWNTKAKQNLTSFFVKMEFPHEEQSFVPSQPETIRSACFAGPPLPFQPRSSIYSSAPGLTGFFLVFPPWLASWVWDFPWPFLAQVNFLRSDSDWLFIPHALGSISRCWCICCISRALYGWLHGWWDE